MDNVFQFPVSADLLARINGFLRTKSNNQLANNKFKIDVRSILVNYFSGDDHSELHNTTLIDYVNGAKYD